MLLHTPAVATQVIYFLHKNLYLFSVFLLECCTDVEQSALKMEKKNALNHAK